MTEKMIAPRSARNRPASSHSRKASQMNSAETAMEPIQIVASPPTHE